MDAWSASLPACLGGWCGRRNGCERYLAQDRRDPAERLCEPGRDGVIDGHQVRFHRPVGTWERQSNVAALLRPATPFDPAAMEVA